MIFSRTWRVGGIVCAFCWASQAAAAAPYDVHGPIRFRNQHPFMLQIANILPMSTMPLAAGETALHVLLDYASVFSWSPTVGHEVLLDMETLRTTLQAEFGVGDGITLGVEVPFVHGGGGFLDGLIDGYHSTFGFPDGGRSAFPRDQFAYRLREGGAMRYDAAPAPLGLGDIVLRWRQQIFPEHAKRPAIGWFAQYELPTGSGAKGLGNREPDYGFGVTAEQSGRRFSGFANLGYFVTSGIPPIEHLMRSAHFSYVVGGEYRMSRRVALHAQMQGGTPLFSGVDHPRWNWPPLDFLVGVSGRHPWKETARELLWEIAFTEDPLGDSPSVDFTMHAQAGIRFGQKRNRMR